jgi:serine phosphatase RsbU (regulator of sigma subunit)
MDNERTQVVTVARNIETGVEERLHCLVLVSGFDVGRRHLVGPAGVTLGRTPPADIVLGDSEVSRLHCRIGVEDDQLVVTDLNSTNGTFVDGKKITGPTPLKAGASLQVGSQSFTHERLTGRQVQKSDELDRDLATANSYVQALLPPPLRDGPIRADWIHLPCAALGGDAFGYGALDANLFVGYLIDVSGHGAGAAMHSVAVMNLLRQRALPNIDMAKPAEVLAALNTMFQMDEHADMYFTIWYGVYDALARRLEFASAGHHPAFLVSADRSIAIGLDAPNLLIGAMPGKTYKADAVSIPPGASLYVFSDGVFEIVTKDGVQWGLSDFESLIMEPPQGGVTEPERLFRAVSAVSKPGGFDDDFSLVVLTFD